ncbi:unnamed protein product [Brassica rapa subsp. trilocularis]
MNLWRHKRHRKPSATTSNLWRIWSHLEQPFVKAFLPGQPI